MSIQKHRPKRALIGVKNDFSLMKISEIRYYSARHSQIDAKKKDL